MNLRSIKARKDPLLKPLTKRQLEYVRCACQRREPKLEEIAQLMGCRPKTVENTRANVYKKWDVHTRMEFIYRAVAEGLVACPCVCAGIIHPPTDMRTIDGWSGV